MPIVKGRPPRGMLSGYTSAGAPSNGTDEVQTLTIGGTPTAGTFKIRYEGETTAAITWSATNGTLLTNINTALDNTANLGVADVVATEDSLTAGIGTIFLTFSGVGVQKRAVALMVAVSSLTGTAPTAVITETTPGVTASGRGAAVGARLTRLSNGDLYTNTGTTTAPVWTLVTNVSTELNTLAGVIPTAAVANLGAYTAGTNLTAVPGTFADEAAVQTYLVTLRAEVETRLDALDAQTALEVTKMNALLAVLRTATIVTP